MSVLFPLLPGHIKCYAASLIGGRFSSTGEGRNVPKRIIAAAALLLIASLCVVQPASSQNINGTSPDKGTRFQYSVRTDGDFAVVGAQWHDGFKGAAYVLRREGGEWVVEQKLSPGDLGRYDHFGSSLAISGDFIVVGASWHDMLRGAVYVFRRVDGEWIEQQKLTAAGAAPEERFGETVSIDGDVLNIVSAEGSGSSFTRSGDRWEESGNAAEPVMSDGARQTDRSPQDDAVISSLVDSGLPAMDSEPPPLPAAPEPVGTVTVTDGTLEGRVEVRWESAGLDDIVYKVLRDGQLLSIVASDRELYIDTTSDLNTVYSYCVVVKDMADEESTPVCDDGHRIIFPPTTVAATDGEFTDRTTVSWVDISKIEEGYYVYRDGEKIDSTEAGGSWIYDTTGIPGSVYDYEVRAFTEGAQSAGVTDTGWRGSVLPPLDVSATDGEYIDRVAITWTDQADDETGYRIYRDSVLFDSTGVGDTLLVVDSTVVFGTTHEYCVATIGAGYIESVHVCDEGGTGLTPPGNVSASDSTYDDRIRITWDDLDLNEDGYEITRALGPDTTVLDTTRASVETYDDYTAIPDTTYTYFVRAVSDLGGVSTVVSDEGFMSIVLAPVNVEATDGEFEDHVDITWESSSKTAVLFKIYRGSLFIKSLSVGNSTYSDYGGTAGQVYDYSVVAATALEAEAAGMPDAGSRELGVPSSVTVSDEEYEDRIVISWTDNSDLEHGYAVTRRDTSAAVDDTMFVIGPNRTSMTDYNAIPGITYDYSVSAFDSVSGEIGYSDPVGDLGLRVLLAPTNVRAGDAEYESKVEIFWEDNSGAEDGYRIYRDDVLIGETADNFNSYIDTSPDLGVVHEYSIAAYDSVYPSAMGESEKDFDTGSTTILAPVSFNASDVYEDRIELAWVDVSGVETGFVILRDEGPSTEPDSIAVTGSNVTAYTDYPPEQGVTYRYCIKSVRDSSMSSDEICDEGSLAAPIPATSIKLSSKLNPIDPEYDDRFGISLGVGRGVAVVGAYRDKNGGINTGSAFLYERDPDETWSFKQKFTPGDGAAGDEFGVSVAVSEGLVMAGARSNNSGTGAVYVFEREPDGSWSALGPKLVASDPATSDMFGVSVSISGDLAVIGANGKNSVTGAAYVFKRGTDGSWTFEDKLIADPPGADGDAFGYSVSIDGETAIIGASGKESSRGAAYVFQRENDSWIQVQMLTADDGSDSDKFGEKVDISGDLAVVGAYGDDNAQGAVYVFERQTDSTWVQKQKLVSSDGRIGDEFGRSVELRERVAIIGAQHDDDDGMISSGSAYLFERSDDGQWLQKQKITASDPKNSNVFGRAVAIGVDAVLIGAWGYDEGALYNSGAAYLLETPSPPEDVSASDGVFDSKVRITWRDVSSIEDGYHIYRDGEPVADVPASIEVFEDYDAEPGRTHEYSVASFRSESEASFSLDRISDYGWRPPNGNITGRISSLGGGASENIFVKLDPPPTRSLLFDGAGGHTRAADLEGDFDFTTGDAYTVEAWFRYTGSGGSGEKDGTLIAKVTPRVSGPKQYPFWLSNMRAEGDPGRLSFSMSDGVKTVGVSSISADLNDNTWHHVACVHDAADDELRIYIDGALENATPYTGFEDIRNPDSLTFGAGATSGSWFGGQLDEIRIWDVERDSLQISETMYSQLSGDEVGLVAYWPLDESRSEVMTDPNSAGHYGVFYGGVYWSNNSAPLNIYTSTGESGSYVLDDIHYGSETTFKVRPFEGNRQFDPPFSLITLSVDQPVQNQVNFSDISSYTLSGVVVFEGTECPVMNAPIYVDGYLKGSTDKNGKFAVSVDNGWHSVKPVLEGHTFEPDSVTVEALGDLVLPSFDDMTTRTLSGNVGGGCGRRIGDVVITVQSENGCLVRSTTADSAYSIILPPQRYLVSAAVVESSIPDGLIKSDVIRFFQELGQREAALDSFDVVMDMTYRAPLKIDIEGFEAYVAECPDLTFEGRMLPENLPVVPQLEVLYLVINVNEDYGSEGLCPLDSGLVVIYDEIFDREGTPIEVEVKDGQAEYTTFASTPSLVIGRTDSEGNDRSFQKAIRAMAVIEGRSPVTAEEWVLVTGHVAEEGADFITATSQLPLYILRDPPGDRSYSFLDEEFSIRFNTDYDDYLLQGETGIRLRTEWGVKGGFFIGFGAGTIGEYAYMAKTETEFLFGALTNFEKRTDVTLVTKKRLATSSYDLFVGEQSDVFVGAGVNYIFSDVEYVDVTDDCEVIRTSGVGFEPDSINTLYAYTQRYIEDVLIPEFQAKADYYVLSNPDSASLFRARRDYWQYLVQFNKDIKREAVFKENRSFSGGTEYSFVSEYDTTTSRTWKQSFISDAYTDFLGFGFGGGFGGFDISFPVKFHAEKNTDFTDTTTGDIRRSGYVINDDNIGDHFTVDIKRDSIYSSTVFDVLAGASSCPYEAWPDTTGEARVMSRDKPVLFIDPPQGRYDVPPDESASFTLTLANLSPTDEARRYVLREIASSNPYGAQIRANGVFINDDLVYYPDPGQSLEITVTVDRGPAHYTYDDLGLMVYPLCEWWVFEDGGPLNLADTVYFDVTFEAPCSDITLYRPESGWLISEVDSTVDLILNDYELEVGDKVLQAVGCEYRRLGEGSVGPTDWDTMFVALPDSILEMYYSWQPDAGLPDGVYELRAFTSCAGGSNYSGIVTGTIDRHGPVVLGTPEPSDEILSFGEDISITFNEPVSCESIPDSCVTLKWLDGPNSESEVSSGTVCDGTTIVIVPTAYAALLEGRRLEASVSGIRDIVGNVMQGAAVWTFEYRKSRFAWSDGDPEVEVPYRDPGSVTAELVNGTELSIDFTVIQTPAWIEYSIPSAGTIDPGETALITFDILGTIEIGSYADSIFVEGISDGDTSLAGMLLTLDVSCLSPQWTVRPGDYEYTMTMVAELDIGGTASDDTNDMVSAWVGNQLRGVTEVQSVSGLPSTHLAFITIYGNRTQGETVRFQVWDDDDCLLYNATLESHPFAANDQIGNPQSPVTLTAADAPDAGDGLLAIDLDAGWNWISTNILSPDMSVDGVTADLLPAPGDIVKSQSDFTQFVSDSTGWIPTMVLDNVSSYLVRLSNAGTIYHSGTLVPVDSVIPVGQGWNWIGYLPDGPIEVTEALDGLDTGGIVSTDDIIKSQDGFAQYYGGEWYGSLDSMRAGEGYKLYLAAAGEHTFNYPAYSAGSSPPVLAAMETVNRVQADSAPAWSVNPRNYQFNMTVTSVLNVEGAESVDNGDIVGAFAGGECRGAASPVYVEGLRRYVIFLMIHSNEAQGEEVTFRAFDADAALVYDIDESIVCMADAVEGTVMEPLVLNAGHVNEEESDMPSAFSLSQNYPNPFNPATEIHYDVPAGGGHVSIRIYDVGGRLVRVLVDTTETAGRKSVEWHGLDNRGNSVATGVYFYRMTAPGFERTRKMVLLK